MGVQTSVGTTIAYKAETDFGSAPGATSAKYLRRVSTGLNLAKDSFASNEVRSDQEVADLRHGGRSARGNIDGELSTETYDDFLEAVLRGTWAAGVSAAPAQFATGLTIATAGGNTTFTFAGSGNLLTIGFKAGDVIRCTGLTATANNAKNLRVTAVTSTTLTVAGTHATQAQQSSGWAVAVAGRKLMTGVEKRSFHIEQRYDDAGVYELFSGVRINGATIGIQPNGMATISFDMMGQNGVPSDAAYFTTPTAETTTGVLSGVDGTMRVGSADLAILTGLQINVTNNLSMPPVIGSVIAPEIFYGRKVITGSLSAFLADETLLAAFSAETEVAIAALIAGAGSEPKPFLHLFMPRVKLSGGTKTVGPDGGVIVQYPFQALLPTGAGSGTQFDAASLVIQRSNT